MGTSQDLPANVSLAAIACPSDTYCVAVGSEGVEGNNVDVVVPIVDGIAGTPQAVPGTQSTESGNSVSSDYLTGVACPTLTECVTVGNETALIDESSGIVEETLGGLVVSITNGDPSVPQSLPMLDALNGVACVSATTCEAVGASPLGGSRGIGGTTRNCEQSEALSHPSTKFSRIPQPP